MKEKKQNVFFHDGFLRAEQIASGVGGEASEIRLQRALLLLMTISHQKENPGGAED